VAELLLHIPLVGFGRCAEPSPKRVARELQAPLAFGQVGAYPSRERRSLHQSRDMLIREPVG